MIAKFRLGALKVMIRDSLTDREFSRQNLRTDDIRPNDPMSLYADSINMSALESGLSEVFEPAGHFDLDAKVPGWRELTVIELHNALKAL